MTRINFLLIAFLLFSGNIFAQTKVTLEKEGNNYTIPACKINGLPYTINFSDEAGGVTISLTEAIFMIKNGQVSKNDILGSSYEQLKSGIIAKNTRIILKEIEIAGLKLFNVQAEIVKGLKVPLLLRRNTLEELGNYEIDGNELIISNKKRNEKIQSNVSNSNKYEARNPYKRTFTGTQEVYTYSPILDNPDMLNSKQIGKAKNNSVTILEKINGKYYKIKSGEVVGYLWSGWFMN